MRFVKDEIAPYKYPRQVSFVETLPRALAAYMGADALVPAGGA